MENKELHPKESLKIIEDMIQTEKMRFSENGHIYRMWGWLVIVAALSHFTLLKLEYYSICYYPWFLMIAGAIYTGFYYSKAKKSTNLPISGKILGMTWIAVCINIFGIAFVLPVQAGDFLLFIILSNLSIGVIVGGALLKYKLLLFGGAIGIVCGYLSIFLPHSYWTLLAVIPIVFTNLIPGYAMKKQSRKLT